MRFGIYTTIIDGDEVNKQRYRCKFCAATFTDLTNTALYRTRRLNKWIKFIECMIVGYSLCKSADLVKGISHVTLFYWRHKLFSALKQIETADCQGVVEMDEPNFLYSEKGQKKIKVRKARKRGGKAKKRGIRKEQACVLVARDRDKNTFSKTHGIRKNEKRAIRQSSWT